MRTPENFLEHSDSAAGVLAHARLLLKLGRCFAAAAPPGLAERARVVNYRMGTVVIYAENGAVAAKLNQSSLRLRDTFLKNGLECNGIEVKVQPVQIPVLSSTSTKKPLSRESARLLEDGARALPQGSPLALALLRLLERVAIKE